MSL
ncbi:unnamed protein product [Cuscuta europaea]|jgi:hypothetical protein